MLTTHSEGSPKVKGLNMNQHVLLHVHYICLFSILLSTTSCSSLLEPKNHTLNAFLQGFRPFLERDVSRSRKVKAGETATRGQVPRWGAGLALNKKLTLQKLERKPTNYTTLINLLEVRWGGLQIFYELFYKPDGTEGLKKNPLTNSAQHSVKEYHGTNAKPTATTINLLPNPMISCQALFDKCTE